MALPQLVQSKTTASTTNTSITCVFPSNVTAGNTLVVFGGAQVGSVVTMSDNLNGTYGAPAVSLSNVIFPGLWVIPNTLGGACTATMQVGSSTAIMMGVMEFNALTLNPVDVTASAHQASTATPSVGPSSSTNAAVEAVVAAFQSNGSKTWSVGGGATIINNMPLTGNFFIEYYLTSGTGTQTATANMTTGQSTAVLVSLIGQSSGTDTLLGQGWV